MNKHIKHIVAGALMLAVSTPAGWSSPETAEIDGMRIGRSLEGSLYQLRLVESGIATAGTLIRIKLSVAEGVDYCVVTGRDDDIADIDLYVYNNTRGILLAQDKTRQSRGAVKWRSQYTGEAEAYVHIVRTRTIKPGSYACFLGSLEIPTVGKPTNPGNPGGAPTSPQEQ